MKTDEQTDSMELKKAWTTNNLFYVKDDKIFNNNGEELSLVMVCDLLNGLVNESKCMGEIAKQYQRTCKHQSKLLADATKNGYLPLLESDDYVIKG